MWPQTHNPFVLLSGIFRLQMCSLKPNLYLVIDLAGFCAMSVLYSCLTDVKGWRKVRFFFNHLEVTGSAASSY